MFEVNGKPYQVMCTHCSHYNQTAQMLITKLTRYTHPRAKKPTMASNVEQTVGDGILYVEKGIMLKSGTAIFGSGYPLNGMNRKGFSTAWLT